jgi:nicotinamidase-related amidase
VTDLDLDLLPNAALVVVDLQAGTAAGSFADPIEGVVANAARLADAFRERGLPVALVRATGLPSGRTAHGGGARELPEQWSAPLDALPAASGDLVVTKSGWSAFAGTTLDAQLRERGVATVVVVGVATTFGIESTARSAYDLGYDVVVVTDAVTDMNRELHDDAITRRLPIMARLATTDDVAAAGR